MTATQAIEKRLSELWQEGAREHAIAFFRRAMSEDLTLAQVAATLRFNAVEADLSGISLNDVIDDGVSFAEAETEVVQPAALAVEEAPSPLPVVQRRRRRSAKQTEEVKELITGALRDAGDGMTTPLIAQMLNERGYEIDATNCAMVLKGMADAGLLRDDAGRPKTWRIKASGQRVASPMVIRKAQVIEQEQEQEQAAAAIPTTSTGLFSHGEIQAAAAALRERFFAKD